MCASFHLIASCKITEQLLDASAENPKLLSMTA
jgi:hypothetical protein